jgi:hypothetical protein
MNRFNLFGLSRIKVLSSAMVLAATLAVLLAGPQPAEACGGPCDGCSGNFGCYSVGQQECEYGGTLLQCGSDHQMHFVCQSCCG